MKEFTFVRAAIVFMLLNFPLPASADHPSLNRLNQVVNVAFLFPDGTKRSDELTYIKAQAIYSKKRPTHKFPAPTPYKIDFWVYAALLDIGMDCRTEVVAGTSLKPRRVVEIDGISNNATGQWIYYVNDIRTKYYINTQSDEDIKSIRFVFEKT